MKKKQKTHEIFFFLFFEGIAISSCLWSCTTKPFIYGFLYLFICLIYPTKQHGLIIAWLFTRTMHEPDLVSVVLCLSIVICPSVIKVSHY